MYAKDDRPSSRNVFPISSLASNEPQPMPKTAREIAEIYEVSDRTIQSWFKVVSQAYPWLSEADLKTGKSAQTRYTSLCQELIADFRASNKGTEEWVAAIHLSNAEKLPRKRTLQERSLEQFSLTPAVEVEVLEEEAFGGRIETASVSYKAQPILQTNLKNLTVTLPTVDTSALDAQTAKLMNQSAQAVEILRQFVTADLRTKLGGVLAQNTNLVAAIQHSAIISAVQDLGVGKPDTEEGDSFRSS